MKTLIVDDEVEMREIIKEILKDLPLEFREASSGKEAWDLFQKEQFDIVITDMKMPGYVNGIQLAEKILQADYSIPVLLVTGYDEKEHMLKAINIGVSDFIVKPFSYVFFKERVERAIDKRKLVLAEIKVIDLLHEMMNISKDSNTDRMSIQERIEYVYELVAILSTKKAGS